MAKRVRCSCWVTENLDLVTVVPEVDEHLSSKRGACFAEGLVLIVGQMRARRRRGWPRSGRRARSRRPSAGVNIALEIPLAQLGGRRLVKATTRADRGLRCSMKRLIVPPLPAASQPSKTMTCFLPHVLGPIAGTSAARSAADTSRPRSRCATSTRHRDSSRATSPAYCHRARSAWGRPRDRRGPWQPSVLGLSMYSRRFIWLTIETLVNGASMGWAHLCELARARCATRWPRDRCAGCREGGRRPRPNTTRAW